MPARARRSAPSTSGSRRTRRRRPRRAGRRTTRPAGGRSSADTDRAAPRRPETPPARARVAPRPAGARPCDRAARRRARPVGRRRAGASPRVRPRRGRRAAGRTHPRRGLAPLEHLVADLDLVSFARAGGLEDRFELGRLRRPTGDAKAALGAEDPEGAPRRLRPVHEIVDELLLVGRRARDDLLRRHELEERPLQLVDPGAGRGGDAEHADDALVVDGERRRLGPEIDLVEDDHLRTFVEAGAVRLELRVDRAPAHVRVVLRGVEHVQQ